MWTLDVATRRRYVQGMTQLSVWYVRALLEQGEISGEEVVGALCRRVNLYRLTDLWDGVRDGDDGSQDAEWMGLAAQIAEWVLTTPMGYTQRLEDESLALLAPLLERRLPKDVGPAPVRPFECWTYELGWEGLADRPGLLGKLTNPARLGAAVRTRLGLAARPSRHGVLHIMNVLVPQSPFDNMPRLAGTLRALIADVRSRQPQVEDLWCNTWLNDHPKFRELLPEVWFQSGVVAAPGNFRNWWGQFARRDGDFNDTAARRFRESGGVFPFRALLCHARVDAIDAWLAERFS